MEESIENKLQIKNRLINFYNNNKVKILTLIFIVILSLCFLTFLNYNKEKKNILIAEKYVEAGLYLASNKKEDAIKLYEEIILSKNKFYSILALNVILEKNLIKDYNKILKYFLILEESISDDAQEDLIIFKKALYMINGPDKQQGTKILNELFEKNSKLKLIIRDILKE
tara:strand:+ start:2023 stop:2532 length:510 start_codon:yes stop_codon:yes gene_type:complete